MSFESKAQTNGQKKLENHVSPLKRKPHAKYQVLLSTSKKDQKTPSSILSP